MAEVMKTWNGYEIYDEYSRGRIVELEADKSDIGHKHSATDIESGTLGIARGGTGKPSHTANSILTGNGYNAIKNVATENGAFYATSDNSAAKFGTLPIAQGGTGATDAATARTNLGITPANIGAAVSDHNHDDEYLSLSGGSITGDLSVIGDLSVNDKDVVLAELADGSDYYGLVSPTESTSADATYIRTTEAGFIPYESGQSEIGTLDYPFSQMVTNSLYVNGKKYGENQILWSSETEGAKIMNGSQTITLSGKVSEQPNGIVLVFSYYETPEGETEASAQDHSWSTHFVPKVMVELNNGGGQLFLMGYNSTLATFGAKYLKIYDDSISGYAANGYEAAVATSGITISNNFYVLRYVIGV